MPLLGQVRDQVAGGPATLVSARWASSSQGFLRSVEEKVTTCMCTVPASVCACSPSQASAMGVNMHRVLPGVVIAGSGYEAQMLMGDAHLGVSACWLQLVSQSQGVPRYERGSMIN